MDSIFINKTVWKSFSEEQMEEFKNSIFEHYRREGFPYYPTDKQWRFDEYSKLMKYDTSSLFDGENFKQTMHGLSLAWSYFPHSFSVPCNDMRTAFDTFSDDMIFKKVIEKRIRIGDNISDSGIRKMLKMFTGTQCVSNFRPTTASRLYDMFAKNGVVWDMSCGYGGRLFGFLKSKASSYIGTEPCSPTFSGLQEISSDYESLYGVMNPNKEISLYKTGSECFIPDKNSLDFCFTSPPYFNCEKYSEEETQSYLKFPSKEKWITGFLYQTFKNCYIGLKPNKIMAINIANVKSFPDIEEQTIQMAKEAGFEMVDTLGYMLSTMSTSKLFKKEPIFIFQKR